MLIFCSSKEQELLLQPMPQSAELYHVYSFLGVRQGPSQGPFPEWRHEGRPVARCMKRTWKIGTRKMLFCGRPSLNWSKSSTWDILLNVISTSVRHLGVLGYFCCYLKKNFCRFILPFPILCTRIRLFRGRAWRIVSKLTIKQILHVYAVWRRVSC